ncbi:hypothetical protein ACFL2T_02650 [Elusimicrobiota bacterium]
MRVGASLAAGLVALLLVGCGHGARYVQKELSSVKSAMDERYAFERISSNTRVHFEAFDGRGNRLNVSSPDWQDLVSYIVFKFEGAGFKYKVIDENNLFILMRE